MNEGPPRAAPARWPYLDHRTVAEVEGDGGQANGKAAPFATAHRQMRPPARETRSPQVSTSTS